MGLEKILRFSRNLAFSSLISLVVLYGCSKKSDENVAGPSGGNNVEDVKQQITSKYYQWANRSQNYDYAGMMELVTPGSNMAGATNVCQSAWAEGNYMCYSFSNVEVTYITENPPDSWVNGNFTLYQTFVEPSTGEFYGGAQPFDGDFYGGNWRLSQMNWNSGGN
ncbi:MAG: hypothetical protein KJ674_02915 [Nanoarchaeota archaeon]|nr:hypothetical protein [Nanoarchaeota archaeon]